MSAPRSAGPLARRAAGLSAVVLVAAGLAAREGARVVDDSGKPIFGEGENRDKMLKALNYYKDLVDSGAAPKRDRIASNPAVPVATA